MWDVGGVWKDTLVKKCYFGMVVLLTTVLNFLLYTFPYYNEYTIQLFPVLKVPIKTCLALKVIGNHESLPLITGTIYSFFPIRFYFGWSCLAQSPIPTLLPTFPPHHHIYFIVSISNFLSPSVLKYSIYPQAEHIT